MLVRMESLLHAHISREDELDTTANIRYSARDISLLVSDTSPPHIRQKTIIFSILESLEIFGPILSNSYSLYMIILYKNQFFSLK